MAGIMNTLWDESSELEDEMLTPHPILSDEGGAVLLPSIRAA